MTFFRRLFPRTPNRTHYRGDGPVVIAPDVREVIHVRN